MKFLGTILSACFLAACSSTKVVLVRDANGTVGQVSVTTSSGQQLLNQAGESTKVTYAQKTPTTPVVLNKAQIDARFSALLANEPKPPIRYILYFKFDSVTLQPRSAKRLSSILKNIAARQSCDISIIGHADRSGDGNYNEQLSLRRATNIKAKLVRSGIKAACMDIAYYGENDPQIATPDGQIEPKNRRVEVQIR